MAMLLFYTIQILQELKDPSANWKLLKNISEIVLDKVDSNI